MYGAFLRNAVADAYFPHIKRWCLLYFIKIAISYFLRLLMGGDVFSNSYFDNGTSWLPFSLVSISCLAERISIRKKMILL